MIKTGSQIEPKRYYLGGLSELSDVRSDITITSIANIISNHIISTDIRPSKLTWASDRWAYWLKRKSYDVIGEMILNALVWGEAIADCEIGVDNSFHYCVTDIIPLDMTMIKKRRQYEQKRDTDITAYAVTYGNKVLDTSRLVNLVLYTEGGSPYPLGLKLAADVKRKQESAEVRAFAVGSGILGNYIAKDDGSGGYDTDAVSTFLNNLGTAMSVKQQLPGTIIEEVGGGVDKAELSAALGDIIANSETNILKLFLMQWMDSSITQTGTYGAFQAYLDAYSKQIDAMALAVCGLMDSVCTIESKLAGMEATKFVNDDIDFSGGQASPVGNAATSPLVFKGLADSGVIAADEIRAGLGLPPSEPIAKTDEVGFGTTDIFGMVDRGIMTNEEARAYLGLPALQPTALPQDANQATRANAVNTWLSKTKKEAVRRAVDKAIQRRLAGQGSQFTFTEIDRLVATTSLDKETATSLAMNLETNLKSLINDVASGSRQLTDFDLIWQGFETEVKNAIH